MKFDVIERKAENKKNFEKKRKKFSNFMNRLLKNLIPPKNSKLAKISSLKFMFKRPYLLVVLGT